MTCNQVYHEECFKTDISIPEREDEAVEDSRIIPIKHQGDFHLGVVSQEVAEDILSEKSPGTFLLRFSLKKRMHVISRKLVDDVELVEHVTVEQVKVGDVMFYSLKPGQGRRSLLLLVENHRLDCELFIPINSGESENRNEENEAEENEGPECTEMVENTKNELEVVTAVRPPPIEHNEHQTSSRPTSLDFSSNIHTGSLKKQEKTDGFDLILQDFRDKKTENKLDIVYELKEIQGTPSDIFQNFLREATKEKVEIKSCLLMPERKRDCLVSTVLGNNKDTDFFVSQYKESSGSKSQNFQIIEVRGTNPVDLVETINRIDQMVENTAGSLHGYLQRRLENSLFSKRDFLRSQDIKIIAGFKTITEQNLNHSKSTFIQAIDEGGNFKDFEELSFEGKEEKIYLDGALKISSTSFQSKFDFRGRIARTSDFQAVTSYLMSEENMVGIKPSYF